MGEIPVVEVLHALRAGGAVEYKNNCSSMKDPIVGTLVTFHLYEIQQKRRFEHPVQFDVLVPEQVLQAASGAVLRHHSEYRAVQEEAEEWVHILISQVLHLRKWESVRSEYEVDRGEKLIPFHHSCKINVSLPL